MFFYDDDDDERTTQVVRRAADVLKHVRGPKLTSFRVTRIMLVMAVIL